MRVLGIDFGEVRIGIAISDPAGKLAVPLTTLSRVSDMDAIAQIQAIVRRENIEHLVLGEPRNMDGSIGDAAHRVWSFRRKLQEQIPLPCDLVDETLTSVEARERLLDAGVNPKRVRERIDQVAAQILLEQYFASGSKGEDD